MSCLEFAWGELRTVHIAVIRHACTCTLTPTWSCTLYSPSHHITPSAHPHMHVALSLPPSPPQHISFTPDECEEVEREAQTLVSIIEDIMGESIQQYFWTQNIVHDKIIGIFVMPILKKWTNTIRMLRIFIHYYYCYWKRNVIPLKA